MGWAPHTAASSPPGLAQKFQNQLGMKNEVKNEYFETYEKL